MRERLLTLMGRDLRWCRAPLCHAPVAHMMVSDRAGERAAAMQVGLVTGVQQAAEAILSRRGGGGARVTQQPFV